jgi:RHS repeat-associated protein
MIDASYGDSTQLLYLRARYYNPADGRFLSRDTWGGNVNQPLSLNRWNYTEGNPINFVDLEGLSKCVPAANIDCQNKAQILLSMAKDTQKGVTGGFWLPVEAFAKFADNATWLFEDDWGDIMWAMTGVLLGINTNRHLAIWHAGAYEGPDSPYFVGQDWLPYKNDPNKDQGNHVYSELGDWNSLYWDDTANQAYHFWFYTAVTYYDGAGWAKLADYVHDPYWNGETQWDISQKDHNLAIKGIELGERIQNSAAYGIWGDCVGNIPRPTVGICAWIRSNLKGR